MFARECVFNHTKIQAVLKPSLTNAKAPNLHSVDWPAGTAKAQLTKKEKMTAVDLEESSMISFVDSFFSYLSKSQVEKINMPLMSILCFVKKLIFQLSNSFENPEDPPATLNLQAFGWVLPYFECVCVFVA